MFFPLPQLLPEPSHLPTNLTQSPLILKERTNKQTKPHQKFKINKNQNVHGAVLTASIQFPEPTVEGKD